MAKALGFVLPQSSYYRWFGGWFGPATWPLAHPSSATMLVAGVGSIESHTVCLKTWIQTISLDIHDIFSTVFYFLCTIILYDQPDISL